MNKLSFIGIISCAGSFIVYLFQAITAAMDTKTGWKDTTLVNAFNSNFDWIDSIPWFPLQSGLDYLTTMPLYLLLLIIGIIFLIIGAFFWEK